MFFTIYKIVVKIPNFQDASLGFAAGVMTAASFWSLLAPALEMSETGVFGRLSFIPIAFGFISGALFVAASEPLIRKAQQNKSPLLDSNDNPIITASSAIQLQEPPTNHTV